MPKITTFVCDEPSCKSQFSCDESSLMTIDGRVYYLCGSVCTMKVLARLYHETQAKGWAISIETINPLDGVHLEIKRGDV